jgi:hypothetical protein
MLVTAWLTFKASAMAIAPWYPMPLPTTFETAAI